MSFDFDESFLALTGKAPFAWQRRLYGAFVEDALPDAVDVPTGLGKTKVMTLWLIARAAGVPLPRRLIYVVDRRAVVDQATTEAQELVGRLDAWLVDETFDTSLRMSWRDNLGLTAGRDLPISTLRGQTADNRRWLDRPDGAAIVVGTIDMTGSRLLFGGYGVSTGMRPAHAGLTGADTLVVLDEAHLVSPFEALIRQVAARTAEDRDGAPDPLVPPLRLMALSATGGTPAGAKVFRLESADEADPPARKRLTAEKRLMLLAEVAPGSLAEKLAERAWTLGGGSRAVLVFCNSRKTAQDVAQRLAAEARKAFGHDVDAVTLLVGERRVRERARLQDRTTPEGAVMARFHPARHEQAAEATPHPAFLVATSAGEVGIDLDADDMVCDLVAWERMVQRFGRVNRRSEPGSARIEIVPAQFDQKDRDAEDDVGRSRLETLTKPFASEHWPRHPDGTLDASPLALGRLKVGPLAADMKEAESKEPLRPALTHPTVDAWALTCIDEHTGRPDVAPWLRGWVEREVQTSVAWRRLFPLRGNREGEFTDDDETRLRDLAAFFEVAPPHLTELLEAPTWRVVEVLRKRAEGWKLRPPDESGPKHPPVVVVLDRRNSVEGVFRIDRIAEVKKETLERLWARRTLVVDARLGGLDESGLLHAKAATPPPTVDDADWGLALDTTAGRRVRWGGHERAEGDWRRERYVWREDPDAEESNALWVEVWRGRNGAPEIGDPAISRSAQPLQDHHTLAARQAAAIADGLKLPEPYRTMLITVAALHDTGKARDLWQNAMRAPDEERPYAKTRGGGDGRALGGYRHEFGSLRDASSPTAPLDHLPETLAKEIAAARQRLWALPDAVRDLGLHLIAAHHGYGRPEIAPIDPHVPPSSSATLAREAALRFARLHRQWGPWGLAWWEALPRAADWAASRQTLKDAPDDGKAGGPAGDAEERAVG